MPTHDIIDNQKETLADLINRVLSAPEAPRLPQGRLQVARQAVAHISPCL